MVLILASHKLVRINYNQLRPELSWDESNPDVTGRREFAGLPPMQSVSEFLVQSPGAAVSGTKSLIRVVRSQLSAEL